MKKQKKRLTVRLPVDRCVPNTWNMNKLSPLLREKLLHGMKALYTTAGRLPPIVVRPHPSEEGQYEIIDGYHRWDTIRSEKLSDTIDAVVLNVDTKQAMLLTDSLNYLRGEPDKVLHGKFFQALNSEHAMSVDSIAEFLPYTSDEIEAIFEANDITPIKIVAETEEETEKTEDTAEDTLFVEVKFTLSAAQQEVVERELARIGTLLTGKNVRGRALEFMAVNSSQTPIENLTGEPFESEDKHAKRLRKMRAKLKAKAKRRRARKDNTDG